VLGRVGILRAARTSRRASAVIQAATGQTGRGRAQL